MLFALLVVILLILESYNFRRRHFQEIFSLVERRISMFLLEIEFQIFLDKVEEDYDDDNDKLRKMIKSPL